MHYNVRGHFSFFCRSTHLLFSYICYIISPTSIHSSQKWMQPAEKFSLWCRYSHLFDVWLHSCNMLCFPTPESILRPNAWNKHTILQSLRLPPTLYTYTNPLLICYITSNLLKICNLQRILNDPPTVCNLLMTYICLVWYVLFLFSHLTNLCSNPAPRITWLLKKLQKSFGGEWAPWLQTKL